MESGKQAVNFSRLDPLLARYLDWLDGHGVRFDVGARLIHGADHDGPLLEGDEPFRPLELPGLPPFVEHRDPAAGIGADHATLFLLRVLLEAGHVGRGDRFWDVGCGTGVVAVAAGLAGARGIIATDVDPRALVLARRTAAEADVAVTFKEGSLLSPVPDGQRADVVTANLPHKPAPDGALPVAQAGGPEGDAVLGAFAGEAARRLDPGARVFFFLHSLPHPRLLEAFAPAFDLAILGWKRRYLRPGEYGPLQDAFLERARLGTSFIAEESGRRILVGGVWRATRR